MPNEGPADSLRATTVSNHDGCLDLFQLRVKTQTDIGEPAYLPAHRHELFAQLVALRQYVDGIVLNRHDIIIIIIIITRSSSSSIDALMRAIKNKYNTCYIIMLLRP